MENPVKCSNLQEAFGCGTSDMNYYEPVPEGAKRTTAETNHADLTRHFRDSEIFSHSALPFSIRIVDSPNPLFEDGIIDVYWPKEMNYEIPQHECLEGKLVDWANGQGYFNRNLMCLVSEVGKHCNVVAGYVASDEVRLLVLKTTVCVFLWDDFYEDLLRMNSPAAADLAEYCRLNTKLIMTGSMPVSAPTELMKAFPVECGRCLEIQRTLSDVMVECRQLLNPKVYQNFLKFNAILYDKCKEEAQMCQENEKQQTHVTMEEYFRIRRYTSFFQPGLLVSLEEEDLPNYTPNSLYPSLCSILESLDNDHVSYPKEARRFSPLNQLERLTQEACQTAVNIDNAIREGALQLISLRNKILANVRESWLALPEPQQRSLDKCFWYMAGSFAAQLASHRYGWRVEHRRQDDQLVLCNKLHD